MTPAATSPFCALTSASPALPGMAATPPAGFQTVIGAVLALPSTPVIAAPVAPIAGAQTPAIGTPAAPGLSPAVFAESIPEPAALPGQPALPAAAPAPEPLASAPELPAVDPLALGTPIETPSGELPQIAPTALPAQPDDAATVAPLATAPAGRPVAAAPATATDVLPADAIGEPPADPTSPVAAPVALLAPATPEGAPVKRATTAEKPQTSVEEPLSAEPGPPRAAAAAPQLPAVPPAPAAVAAAGAAVRVGKKDAVAGDRPAVADDRPDRSEPDTAAPLASAVPIQSAPQPLRPTGAALGAAPSAAGQDVAAPAPGSPQPPASAAQTATDQNSEAPAGAPARAQTAFADLVQSRDAPPLPARMNGPEAQPGPAPATSANLPPALAAAASTPSPAHPVVTARPGQIGHELGVQIARTVSLSGEHITVRLNPVEMGRIEVRMSFDDGGSLRALVAADSPVALDMLRRDAADLGRALADAGIRSDAQSFRFDSRSGGGGDGAPFGQRQHQGQNPGGDGRGYRGGENPEEPVYRSLRGSGQVDLMA